MRRRASFWLAWSLAGLSAALYAGAFVYVVKTLIVDSSATGTSAGGWGPSRGFGELLLYLPFFAFPVVGALVASRRPGNPIGWICLVAGLFWMTFALNDASNAYGLASTGKVTSSIKLDALTQTVWVLPVGLLGVYMNLLFPDGRLPSRRWRPFAWFSGAVMFSISVVFVFVPGPLEGHPGMPNPFGLEQFPWLKSASVFVVVLLPLCILVSAASLVVRYRRSGREVREQIKWLAFAAGLVGVVYLGSLMALLLFSPETLTINKTPPLWISILLNGILLSYATIPVAVGIAILKYRLYDIDIIVNRALVYGPLTVSLALVYFGGVAATQLVFRALTGQEQQPQLAVVVSTLAIAALFNPLRRRIQSFIDRRFYRRKYDASRILAAYGTRLRDEADMKTLSDALLGVLQETVQPTHASLWLRSPEGKPPAGER